MTTTAKDIAFKEAYATNVTVSYSAGEFILPKWFINKNLSQNQAYAVSVEGCGEAVKETEKAIDIEFTTDYGKVWLWCPKSILKTIDEVADELLESAKKFNDKMNKRAELIERMRALGIKGISNHQRTETIFSKAKEQGVDVSDIVKWYFNK
jgi:type III secretion system FlhB-like substrate exporter